MHHNELIPNLSITEKDVKYILINSHFDESYLNTKIAALFTELVETYTGCVYDHENNKHIFSRHENHQIEILLQSIHKSSSDVLNFSREPSASVQILLLRKYDLCVDCDRILKIIETQLRNIGNIFSAEQIDLILSSMPLVKMVSDNLIEQAPLSNFALIWRDHFLEENIALLRAFETAGIHPEWIFTLSKGDYTFKCENITAYFYDRGYSVDILDSGYDSQEREKMEIERVKRRLQEFITNARSVGKKILLIDDGGILYNCFSQDQKQIDCAVEVTIIGVKRLRMLPHIDVPVYDMGRSQLKKIITYPEIAASGVNRVREMIPAEKIRGQRVLVLGYGTSGKHVARIFQSMGCQVSIVDIKIMPLIEAAENGYRTFTSAQDAIIHVKPFLVFGCSGEIALSLEDYDALPNGCFVTANATKDLSVLRTPSLPYKVRAIPYFGYSYEKTNGDMFYQLGDGRSFNLFMSEAIPNKANDVFKAGIFLSALDIATKYEKLPGGIYLNEVDEMIEKSGLLERYYSLYLEEKYS